MTTRLPSASSQRQRPFHHAQRALLLLSSSVMNCCWCSVWKELAKRAKSWVAFFGVWAGRWRNAKKTALAQRHRPLVLASEIDGAFDSARRDVSSKNAETGRGGRGVYLRLKNYDSSAQQQSWHPEQVANTCIIYMYMRHE